MAVFYRTVPVYAGIGRGQAVCVCVLKAHRGESRDCSRCRQAGLSTLIAEAERCWLLSD